MRLIDADELMNLYDGILVSWKMIIKEAPTVDAEPVVRCKDCTHKFAYEKSGHIFCFHHGMSKDADDYCSNGSKDGE